MKKVLSLLLALSLLLSFALLLVSCAPEEPAEELKKEPTAMTVALNPEVEFLLDANGTVVSANALNEEGNLVLNAEVFVGKTGEEAIKLFVDVAKDTGFLVSAGVQTEEAELKIAFSGDEAAKRYDAVKDSIDRYLKDKGVDVALKNADALGDEYLNAALAECLPYLDEAKIAAMTYEEKLAALKESRLETATLYSEQLKEAYYAAKERAYEEAKLTYVKEHANAIAAIAFDSVTKTYFELCDTLETLRRENLIDEESPYQTALAAFREAKASFLNYRAYIASLPEDEVTDEVRRQLDALQSAAEKAETALNAAYETANAALDAARAQLDIAYDAAITAIGALDDKVQTYLSEAEESLGDGLDAATETFETSYAEAVAAAKDHWSRMEESLKNGYRPE